MSEDEKDVLLRLYIYKNNDSSKSPFMEKFTRPEKPFLCIYTDMEGNVSYAWKKQKKLC